MWGIAWRNFVLQFERYRVLATALVLGAAVFTVLFGVTTSLTSTVRLKAARFFSGDVMVLEFSSANDYLIRNEGEVKAALDQAGSDIVSYHRRSLYYETDAKLYFNGAQLPQRRIIGLDFSVERLNFLRQEFLEGGLPDNPPADGIWVSSDTAGRLHLRAGDEVTLQVKTKTGARNTLALRVIGIFQDNSFFGFAAYLDYRTLNKGIGRPEGAITEMGVSLSGPADVDTALQRVQQELVKLVPTTGPVRSLDDVYKWLSSHPADSPTYAVLPLSGRLKQVTDLIQAIYAVNALLAFVFLVVVAIGVYNTYQMIAYERIKEIGTMRALGMQKRSVIALFLIESLFLGLLGSVAGLLAGALALRALGLVDFSGNLLAQMFLDKGHVAWSWPWQNMVGVLGVMWLTTLAGALVPAWRASQRRPVDALRQE
jgi:putative ABC transport system permease protein